VISLISGKNSMIMSFCEQVSEPQMQNRNSISALDIVACIHDIGVLGYPLYNQYASLKQIHEVIRNNNGSLSTNNKAPTTTIDSLFQLLADYSLEHDHALTYTQGPGWFLKCTLSNLSMITLPDNETQIRIPLEKPQSTNSPSTEEATYNLDKFPQSENWLEPAEQYYIAIGKIIENMRSFQKEHYPSHTGLLADIQRTAMDKAAEVYRDFITFTNMLSAIAHKELAELTLTKEEQTFILTIPAKLSEFINRLPALGDYTGCSSATMVEEQTESGSSLTTIVPDTQKRALYIPSYRLIYRNKTNSSITELFCAPGLPLILYIPIKSSSGKQFIATGFMYSYTEFTQDIGGITHEEWKKIILSQEARAYELPWE